MCAYAKMTSLVYYEKDFSCILRKGLLSCIMKHLFIDYTLTARTLLSLILMFCMRYDCPMTISQYFAFSIYDFLILKIFVIFCNSSIDVYY